MLVFIYQNRCSGTTNSMWHSWGTLCDIMQTPKQINKITRLTVHPKETIGYSVFQNEAIRRIKNVADRTHRNIQNTHNKMKNTKQNTHTHTHKSHWTHNKMTKIEKKNLVLEQTYTYITQTTREKRQFCPWNCNTPGTNRSHTQNKEKKTSFPNYRKNVVNATLCVYLSK